MEKIERAEDSALRFVPPFPPYMLLEQEKIVPPSSHVAEAPAGIQKLPSSVELSFPSL